MDQYSTLESSDSDVHKMESKREKILATIFLVFSVLALSDIMRLFTSTTYDLTYYIDLFDVLIALVMSVIVVMLFKHKPVLKWFMYVVLIGSAGSIIFWVIEKNWLLVTAEVALAAYVVYYTTTPLTKKVYKKANYVLLPLAIALGLLGGLVGAMDQAQVRSEIVNPNSAFNLASLELQQAYLGVVGEHDVILLEGKLSELETANDKKLAEIDKVETKAQSELKSSNADFAQYNKLVLASMEAHKQQCLKIKELIDYNKLIDNSQMTQEQSDQNLNFIQEITALETPIRQTGAEL